MEDLIEKSCARLCYQVVYMGKLSMDIRCEPYVDSLNRWPLVMEAGTRQNVQIMHERGIRYVSDAWKTLLSHAPKVAEEHGIKPHELILSKLPSSRLSTLLTWS